uniref:Uncharacterized protein n=1 Tax=Tetraselmis sp. GSL018 TaxID=582737 RepID=A0A061R801_9CHLO
MAPEARATGSRGLPRTRYAANGTAPAATPPPAAFLCRCPALGSPCGYPNRGAEASHPPPSRATWQPPSLLPRSARPVRLRGAAAAAFASSPASSWL